MKYKFDPTKEYSYYGHPIGKFKRHRPLREYQTYIWNGYAYFEKKIVHYSNYEWIEPITKTDH